MEQAGGVFRNWGNGIARLFSVPIPEYSQHGSQVDAFRRKMWVNIPKQAFAGFLPVIRQFTQYFVFLPISKWMIPRIYVEHVVVEDSLLVFKMKAWKHSWKTAKGVIKN